MRMQEHYLQNMCQEGKGGRRNLKAMEEMARALGMDRLPRRVEGYDISNTSGQEAVASMVVMTDGGLINPVQAL